LQGEETRSGGLLVTPGTQRDKAILIVANEASLREGATSLLQDESSIIHSARDDQEALDFVRHHPPNLILVDPTWLGPVSEWRRRHLALTGTPLVVLGSTEAGREEADVHLPWPIAPEELRSVVRQYLSRPQPGILVVEDDVSIQHMFQVALEGAGFIVWLAATGERALELLQQHGTSITLAVLDVQIDGPLDGPQTALALRQLRPDLPFCFMSGNAGLYTAEQLLALGAAHVFPKPIPSLAEMLYLLWKMVPRLE
jgi:CheY-like chemotaxis protein